MKVTLQNMRFVAASLLVSTIGYSQVHVGAKLGLTFPGISYTQFDGQKFSKHKTGIQAGVFFSIPLAKQFELRPGGEITSGYGRVTYDQGSFSFVEDLTYFDIPVYLMFTQGTKYGKILLGAGPAMKNMFNSDMYDNYKSVDWAINALAVYEFTSGFSLNLNYQKSLTTQDGGPSSRYYYGITAGYLF